MGLLKTADERLSKLPEERRKEREEEEKRQKELEEQKRKEEKLRKEREDEEQRQKEREAREEKQKTEDAFFKRIREEEDTKASGPAEVIVYIDRVLDFKVTVNVTNGMTVYDIKELLAKDDPTGMLRPEDIKILEPFSKNELDSTTLISGY